MPLTGCASVRVLTWELLHCKFDLSFPRRENVHTWKLAIMRLQIRWDVSSSLREWDLVHIENMFQLVIWVSEVFLFMLYHQPQKLGSKFGITCPMPILTLPRFSGSFLCKAKSNSPKLHFPNPNSCIQICNWSPCRTLANFPKRIFSSVVKETLKTV